MDIENFKPKGDNLLVRIVREEASTGGLILVDTSHNPKHPLKCKVEAVGPGELRPDGKRLSIDCLKPGDMILVAPMGPVMVGRKRVCDSYADPDWESLIIVSEKEVLAILETEPTEQEG